MKRISHWTYTAMTRLRRYQTDKDPERGASSIEYAGIVILVAGIIIAIRGLGLDSTISSAIGNWVNAALGGG